MSVDIESGYGCAPSDVAATAIKIARTGAVGINFEDQKIGEDTMYGINDQCDRLRSIRAALDADHAKLFINARTDLFLQTPADQHPSLVLSAVERAEAYRHAGADGFFVPGLVDPTTIAMLSERVALPLNIMSVDGAPSLSALGQLGVARVSFGPLPYRRMIDALTADARTVYRR